MKEYIAETGGRYTYSDDILNLQDLALSMTVIFSECSAFIISGCTYTDGGISAGYLWLGGKVRYFEGAASVALPYYIYESNSTETVVYANEANKKGRSCYLCRGGVAIPETIDEVTGVAPAFVEITADYAPRLIDKFFGRYSLLLDTPALSQRVKKDVTFAGNVTSEKSITSSKELVAQDSTGNSIKAKVSDGGDGSLGFYLSTLLACEIVLGSNGAFSFMSGSTELARLDESGFICNTLQATEAYVSSLYLYQSHITNRTDNNNTGAVSINYTGYSNGVTKFRNFYVYDGKKCSIPIFTVEGENRTATIDGTFVVSSTAPNHILKNRGYLKSDVALTASSLWKDSADETIAEIGFVSNTTHDFSIQNYLGNIILTPKGYLNVVGDFKLKGVDIYSIFTTSTTYTDGMATKVDKVDGKQLSTEDFTTEYMEKLKAIAGSNLESGGSGYVTAADVASALKMKLSADENLLDVMDKAAARTNLSVYAKTEGDARYLRITNNLAELVALTAEEINGMTAEEASALKAERQKAVRDVIKAEEYGIGSLKLTMSLNLSDLPDKATARKNISVYSTSEIDSLLAGKLSSDSAYSGAIFTEELKTKLEGISQGSFAYVDSYGTSFAMVNGYALVSDVNNELKKYAPLLLTGYSTADKATIVGNIDLYTKTQMDSRYGRLSELFSDYIAYLVSSGSTASDAQKTLRGKIDALSVTDAASTYMRRDSKLTDLTMADTTAQKAACNHIGAGYKDDYQLKLVDTGWQMMSNYGTGTDCSRIYVRQIGNIVNIQGTINTARREGTNSGGVVAAIPNTIQPPPYGARTTYANWDDDTKYNRGSTLIITAGSRYIQIYESGMYNSDVQVNITYFV
ncbi:MAG: hypothetical protein SNI70_11195 [Rikenellaceae bacterium]